MKSNKSNPIPTRFDTKEADFLLLVGEKTGIPKSEIIRRSVKMLRHYAEKEHSLAFLLNLTT